MNALFISQGVFPKVISTLKSYRPMNASEIVRRYADEREKAEALLIASKYYEDEYK
jgi:hypothetical protein